jgi:pyruvate formate lyase activating enzyme
LFSGGEASLQPTAIRNLAQYAKKLELKVGIETNGTKPHVLKTLLKSNLLDFVGMDLKAPLEPKIFEKATSSKTFFKTTEDVIKNIEKSIKILKQYDDVEIEIRTTVVPSLVYKKEDILKIAKLIDGLHCTWVLQQFRPEMGELINPHLKNIDAPSKKFINNLKNMCLREFPNLRIEVKAVG